MRLEQFSSVSDGAEFDIGDLSESDGRLQQLIPFHLLLSSDFQNVSRLIECAEDLVAFVESIVRIEFCERRQCLHGLEVGSLLVFHARQGNQLGYKVNVLRLELHVLVLLDLLLHLGQHLDEGLLEIVDICVVGLLEVLLERDLLPALIKSGCGTQFEVYLLNFISSIIAVASNNSGALEIGL